MEEREVFSQTDVRLKRKIITKIMGQPVLAVTVLLLQGKQTGSGGNWRAARGKFEQGCS